MTNCAVWPTHPTAKGPIVYLIICSGDVSESSRGGCDTMSKSSVLVRKRLKGRLVLALAAAAAVLVIQVLFGASPALALNERPDDTYMTNGEVYATALSGDGKTLYIGGKF